MTYDEFRSLAVGDRIELSPATDQWMMGAQYGTIRALTPMFAYVKLDKVNYTVQFMPELLQRKV